MKISAIVLFTITSITVSAQHRLNMNFSDMGASVGKMLYVRVVDNSSPIEREVALVKEMIEAPSFSLSILALLHGNPYTVDFFVDMNGNDKYDAPPTDHSWRRVIPPVMDSVDINFVHSADFTDIPFTNPAETMPSMVTSEWSGTWTNLTFGTDGSGNANLALDYNNRRFTGSITMDGAFGSPVPITIAGSGPFSPERDSAVMNVDEPFAGSLTFVRGSVSGSITYAQAGVTMDINGNYGYDQIMFTYNMTGAFTANGWMVLNRTSTTGITDNTEARSRTLSIFPMPVQSFASLMYEESLGEPNSIVLYNVLGTSFIPVVQSRNPSSTTIDMHSLPPGVYSVSIGFPSSNVRGMLFK